MPAPAPDSGLTALGKLAIAIFVIACLGVAAWWLTRDGKNPLTTTSGNATPVVAGKGVVLGVAYGSEKKRWFEWAAQEFMAGTGAGITIDLIPLGSLESGKAIVNGDTRIHVWSPASQLAAETVAQDFEIRQGRRPFTSGESLALSPMVMVWWKERYVAFQAKYGASGFPEIAKALSEKSGWQAIANQPNWGLFKFGHTHPAQSNSGLLSLVLMAHRFHKTAAELSVAQIVDPAFQQWMATVGAGVSGMSNSTGTQMKEMVLKGPSAFDCLLVYESAALDYLENAKGRWGELLFTYPQYNLWNDHPYYVLDAQWVDADHKRAAKAFRDFLLSPAAQSKAREHGLRPADPAINVLGPDSPFVRAEPFGWRNDPGTIVPIPKAEVITNLLQTWLRANPGR